MTGAVSKLDNIFLALRGLIVAAPAAFLLLANYLFANFFILRLSSVIAVSVSTIICIALLPLIYFKINSTVVVFSGKYHLPLAIFSLVAPIAFVASFFSYSALSIEQHAIIFGALFPIALFGLVILFTITNAIARRMVEPSRITHHNLYAFIASAAAILAVVASYLAFSRLSPYNAASSTIFASAVLTLLGAIFTFIASSSHLPRFIRLEAPTQRTIAQKYKEYFSPFFHSRKWASTLSVFTLLVAVFASSFNMVRGTYFFNISSGYFIFAAITLFCLFFLSFMLSDKLLTGQNRFYIKLISALLLLNALVLMSIRHFTTFGIIDSAIYIITFGLVGIAFGTGFALIKLNSQEALMQVVGLKTGIADSFYILLIALAGAIGYTIAQATGAFFSGIIVNAVAFAFMIIFVVLSAFETKGDNLMLNIPDYITQTKIADDITNNEITISDLDNDLNNIE